MPNLDKPAEWVKLDPDKMLQHVQELPDQIEAAWKQVERWVIPAAYVKVKNIVILGMGGSAIGGDLAAALAKYRSKVPLYIQRDYSIPQFVSHESLVIGISYSGNTEETISGFTSAAERNANLIGISTGGKIAPICRKYHAPLFEINYGAQPRAALGYLFTGVLGVLYKLRLLELEQDEVAESLVLLRSLATKIGPTVPTNQNSAKQLTVRLKDRIPVIVGSGTLEAVARRFKTQLNENAKQFAVFEAMPELCHNFIVGLGFPRLLKDKIFVIMLQSKYDHPRNKLRQSILFQILQRAAIPYETVFMHPAGTVLGEMLQQILFGDYLSYYLAIQNNVNPTEILPINYLKEKLEATP